MKLLNFIRVYDGVFSEEFCDILAKKTDHGGLESVDYSKNPDDKYNCNAAIQSNKTVRFYDGVENGDIENISYFVFKHIDKAIEHYIQDLGYQQPFHPSRYKFEVITLSRYLNNNQDEYGLHIGSDCICSSSKTLMIIGLLNHVGEGGEISFPDLGVNVKLNTGSILIFPGNWMFPFKINKPVSNPQYIFNTFTHFADPCNQPDVCLHPIHQEAVA